MINNEVAKALRAAAQLLAKPSTAGYLVTVEASIPLHEKLVADAAAALGDSDSAQRLLRVHGVTHSELWSKKDKAELILSAATSRLRKSDVPGPGRRMSVRDNQRLADFVEAMENLVNNFHGMQSVLMLRHELPVIGHRADDIVHFFDSLAEAVHTAMSSAPPDAASFAVDIKSAR